MGEFDLELELAGREYLDAIINGSKRFEGRLNNDKIMRLKAGDLMSLYEVETKRRISCRVVSVVRYESFRLMLEDKGVETMLPVLMREDLNEEERLAQGVAVYRSFPGYAVGEENLGCSAIEVEFLKLHPQNNL